MPTLMHFKCINVGLGEKKVLSHLFKRGLMTVVYSGPWMRSKTTCLIRMHQWVLQSF